MDTRCESGALAIIALVVLAVAAVWGGAAALLSLPLSLEPAVLLR